MTERHAAERFVPFQEGPKSLSRHPSRHGGGKFTHIDLDCVRAASLRLPRLPRFSNRSTRQSGCRRYARLVWPVTLVEVSRKHRNDSPVLIPQQRPRGIVEGLPAIN